jgi:hypothetical protein
MPENPSAVEDKVDSEAAGSSHYKRGHKQNEAFDDGMVYNGDIGEKAPRSYDDRHYEKNSAHDCGTVVNGNIDGASLEMFLKNRQGSSSKKGKSSGGTRKK